MLNTKHIKAIGVRSSPALRAEQCGYFHNRMLCISRLSHLALLEKDEAIQVSPPQTVNRFSAAPSTSNAASRFSTRTIPPLTLFSMNPKMAHLKIWGQKVKAAPLHT